ncbi:hexapeptide transferase [Deinococcus aerolatus]|uniref:Hexapeptide transferase n=1 Tax=Deinococcus aerolatus TaxID=522487 RepID=A0ABQ2G4U2_9DEIO|nr:acetyltransferase [Deinococcus aerolatus]GGL75084.1 hexapeptide transferase [Deinococcus aerolatus]
MSGILVVGAGGHAKVVIATLRAAGLDVAGVLDDRAESWGTSILGCSVLGGLDQLERLADRAVIAIGSNAARLDIATRFPDTEWTSAIHPAATVHESVRVGPGTVIFAGAVIQPDTVLGRHVIVNTGATVDHDCVLGDYAHAAPGVHLAGTVRLEEGVFLGVGCAVTPGITVGRWTTVGAGGVVVRSLPANAVAVGIPARPRKETIPT